MGAYSHLACQDFRPGAPVYPCVDFAQAIAAVHDGHADLACLPVDNSIAGRVADMHRLLPQSNLRIVGETFLPIHHCVLGKPGTSLSDIRHIHSHVHALPQCSKYISLKCWQPHVASDTAAAALWVASQDDNAHAAIASRIAGEIYGLGILAENIEDNPNNTTRFILMAPVDSRTARQLPNPAEPCLTSFVFKVRSIPAALYKSLGGFATNGLNLVKVESYMADGDFQSASFYAEVEGHPDTKAMQHALDELSFYADDVMLLGTYLQHSYRRPVV